SCLSKTGCCVATRDDRAQQYRQAEQALWTHYGLRPKEHVVEIDQPHAHLRVQELGSGPPMLFLHGTGGIGPMWGPLLRELPDYRCLLLDRPGWGMSSSIDYTRREYKVLVADVANATLDALGVDTTHVVGASIGDVWALGLGAAQPARVDKIVLLGGGPVISDVPVPRFIRMFASPVGAIMVRLKDNAKRTRSILRSIGHGASLDAGRIPDEYIRWRVTLGNTTDSMRHERDMVRAIVKGGSFRPGLTFTESELAGIKQPTLLVYGTADKTAPVRVWQRLVDVLPHGELHLIEDGGHLPWLDDPAQVGGRIKRFLGS
ncbi:MAG: alpha/beta fold hydrolase, partial [bacterium]